VGIWRRYIEIYAFLTTTPNSLVATINHERMPVLLTCGYPPGQMRIVQEGMFKEDREGISEPASAIA
jgi:putative SOS response-associated peptidase YedK